jgi:WD40 repeat protein
VIRELHSDFDLALRQMPHDHCLAIALATVRAALQRLDFAIARHPTTLFQELYNLLRRSEEDETTTHDPRSFSHLASVWREAIEDLLPMRPWIEALYRPPQVADDRLIYSLHRQTGIRHMDVSPSGQHLAVASDTSALVYDAHVGSLLVEGSTHSAVIAVAFSPDSASLGALTVDGWLYTFNSDTGEVTSRFQAIGPIKGSQIVGAAKLMETFRATIEQFKPTRNVRYLYPPDDLLYGTLAFSPDGSFLAACGGAYESENPKLPMIAVLEIATGRLLTITSELLEVSSWTALAFTIDTPQLIAASLEKGVLVLDLASGMIQQDLAAHYGVTNLALSPTGTCIAMGGHWKLTVVSLDGTTNYHSLVTDFDECRVIWPDVPIAFESEHILLTASCDQSVRRFRLNTDDGSLEHAEELLQLSAPINSLKVTSNGACVAVSCTDNTVSFASLEQQFFRRKPPLHGDDITDMALTADGELCASVCEAGMLVVWQVEDILVRRATMLGQGIWSVRFCPEGRKIACGLKRGTLFVTGLDPYDLSLRDRIHEDDIVHAAFSPDGMRIVTTGSDLTMAVVNLGTFKVDRTSVPTKRLLNFEFAASEDVLISNDDRFWCVPKNDSQPLEELPKDTRVARVEQRFAILRHKIRGAHPDGSFMQLRHGGLGAIVFRDPEKSFVGSNSSRMAGIEIGGNETAVLEPTSCKVFGWIPLVPEILIANEHGLLAGSSGKHAFFFRLNGRC